MLKKYLTLSHLRKAIAAITQRLVAVENKADSIPTKVSDLTNDAGYLTLSTLPIYDGTVTTGGGS